MALYKQDPNNTKKQIPDVSGVSGTGRFSHAILPGHELVQKRCSYVIVNTVGKYSFLYETTSSYGKAAGGTVEPYVSGSVIENAAGGPIKLDINPIAWYKSDTAGGVAAKGDVTFVYVRPR